MEFDLVLDGGGAEHEDPAVPQVAAGLEIGHGRVVIGLFHESLDAPGTVADFFVFGFLLEFAEPDVSVARFGMGGRDTQGHDFTPGRVGRGRFQDFEEHVGVGDEVVGRQNGQDGVRVPLQASSGRHRDTRGRVPGQWLHDDVVFRDVGEKGHQSRGQAF